MAHSIKLLYGNDPATPRRSLDLASGSDNLYLNPRSGDLATGQETIIWTDPNPRSQGQRRIKSSRRNAELSLGLDLRGSTTLQLQLLRQQISRFFEEARLHAEEGSGQKVWLEYRWDTSLGELPQPVFGQLSQFWQVLAGGIPKWPQLIHDLQTMQGIGLGVVCNFTCTAFGEGLERQAGSGAGQLEIFEDGLLIPGTTTNKINNPSFGHSTWNNGWSVSNAALKAINETEHFKSLNSAARLHNTGASDYTFTETLTLTAVGYRISCVAKRTDGNAVTSSDIQLWGQGGALTTSFEQIDNSDWYLCYADYTAAASSSTHGVQIKAGREIIVDNVMIHLQSAIGWSSYPLPFCAGFLFGCSWSGTPHASESNRSNGQIGYTIDDWPGQYTVEGWVKALWANDDSSGGDSRRIFQFYADANNLLTVSFITYVVSDPDKFFVGIEQNGSVTSDYSVTQTISYGDWIHVAVVGTVSSVKLYINGSELISLSTSGVLPGSGTFYLSSTLEAFDGLFDGWRILPYPKSDTQVEQSYNNELSIKTAYNSIGYPLFLWTKDGDGGFDAVDGEVSSAAKDNWGIVGGVPGEVEAICEWQIQPPTSSPSRVYWLGRKAVDISFTPSGTLWLDFSGTADAGASSGDAYESSGAGTGDVVFDATLSEVIAGTYEFLARLKVSTNSVVVRPYYQLGTGDRVEGDSVTIGTNANFLFRDIGELALPADAPGVTFKAGLVVERASTATVDVDFVALLPVPHSCRLEAEQASLTVASGDVLVTAGHVAQILDASDNYSQLQKFEFEGNPVSVLPHKYNYIFLLQGEEGQQYSVTRVSTVDLFVTPRYLLPGGAVA